MDPRALTETILRLAAQLLFWLGLEQVFPYAVTFGQMLAGSHPGRAALWPWFGLGGAAGLLVALLAVLKGSARLAGFLTAGLEASGPGGESWDLRGIGASLLGLFLALRGALGLAQVLITWRAVAWRLDLLGLGSQMSGALNLLQLGTGVGLFAGSAALGGILRKALAQRPRL
ncbi:MAG: hypothetical protein P4L36_01250 [Holophaga sp.]|nr:hypothetical protein [Holophaga sp.]